MAPNSPQDQRDLFLSIVSGWAREGEEIKNRHGLAPLPGSHAADDLAAEPGLATELWKHPVEEVHSLAELRLIAAQSELRSLSYLLRASDRSAAACSTLARTIMETAAGAWLILDPALSVEERVKMMFAGRISFLRSLWRWEKAPGLTRRLRHVARAARAAGFRPHIDEGVPTGIAGASVLGPSDIIGAQLGVRGRFAYSVLSAFAHGDPDVLIVDMTPVPAQLRRPGINLMKLDDVPAVSLAPRLRFTLESYELAIDRKAAYFGWDPTGWSAWKTEAHRAMDRLLAQIMG